MAKPKKPQNFYINRNGSASVLVWDKVIKDVEQNYIEVDGYKIYSSTNPNGGDWETLGEVLTDDRFVDKDVFFIHYTEDNLLFMVCPFKGSDIGECAVSAGISSEGAITVPSSALWDSALWDIDLWG